MRTPQNIRGRYYPGLNSEGCKDYDLDPVVGLCSSYSPHRVKCLSCHAAKAVTSFATEDLDLKLAAQIQKVTPKHRQAVQQLELLTRQTIFANEMDRLSCPGSHSSDD